jgi:hypothetical protein
MPPKGNAEIDTGNHGTSGGSIHNLRITAAPEDTDGVHHKIDAHMKTFIAERSVQPGIHPFTDEDGMKIIDANGFDPSQIKNMVAVDCDEVLDRLDELEKFVIPGAEVSRKFDPRNTKPISEERRASIMRSLSKLPDGGNP